MEKVPNIGKNSFQVQLAISRKVIANKENKCEICEQMFTSIKLLKKHFYYVHDQISKGFNCNICSKSILTQENLNLHMKEVHDGKKLYECDS